MTRGAHERRRRGTSPRKLREETVRAAIDGDDGAFAAIVERYQDAAVAYAASVLRDYDAAEDAAQDAFVDAHRLLASLKDVGAFASWLRTIVFKHCDRIRRRAKRSVALSDAADLASGAEAPDDGLERAERAEAIRRAIAKLPAGERSVVLLFYMADQPQDAIAGFLGITVNTVKTRLYSARRRLRRMMMGDMLEASLRCERPSSDPRFMRRVLAAVLPVQVFSVDDVGRRISAGATISARTAEIPRTPLWFIEPRTLLTPADWDKLICLMRSLRVPGLGGAGQLTDEVLRRLATLEHLTYVDMSGSREVTDEGLARLSRCRHLEHLDISGTAIGDAGLVVLESLPRLRVFEARHLATVSDSGIVHLRHASRLERVNLMGTPTGDGAVRALSGKSNLRELFLGSSTTDSGLALLSEIPRFRAWHPAPNAMSLLAGQMYGTFVWINLACAISDRGLRHLGGLQGVAGLSLFGGEAGPFDGRSTRVTPAALQDLTSLEHLTWLGCTARLCDDEAMRRIARMPRLRFLMCQDAVAGDAGFSALAESASIAFVWGRRCYNLTSAGFERLSTMPSLRGLAVSCRNVEARSLGMLRESRRLRELMPIDVSDQGFAHIGRCEQLEALHCMYCPTITDRAADHIRGLPHLRQYQAWGTQATDRTLRVLGKMRSLEHIRLSGCSSLTDKGLRALARLPKLKTVDLEHLPGVTMGGAGVFPADVRVNYTP